MRKLLLVLLTMAVLAVAPPAAADPPTVTTFTYSFEDVNPCTGLIFTVTITVTNFEHSHDGRIVVITRRTITTDDGFVGQGVVSFVDNGQVERFSVNDILANPAGDRIRGHFAFVLDLSTDTVRVARGVLTCLGPA
jgi:hypothetical protein